MAAMWWVKEIARPHGHLKEHHTLGLTPSLGFGSRSRVLSKLSEVIFYKRASNNPTTPWNNATQTLQLTNSTTWASKQRTQKKWQCTTNHWRDVGTVTTKKYRAWTTRRRKSTSTTNIAKNPNTWQNHNKHVCDSSKIQRSKLWSSAWRVGWLAMLPPVSEHDAMTTVKTQRQQAWLEPTSLVWHSRVQCQANKLKEHKTTRHTTNNATQFSNLSLTLSYNVTTDPKNNNQQHVAAKASTSKFKEQHLATKTQRHMTHNTTISTTNMKPWTSTKALVVSKGCGIGPWLVVVVLQVQENANRPYSKPHFHRKRKEILSYTWAHLATDNATKHRPLQTHRGKYAQGSCTLTHEGCTHTLTLKLELM